MISDERVKDREVFATSGIFPWSFVTQIFHNSQSSCGCGRKTFEVMTNVHHPNRFAHTYGMHIFLPLKGRNDKNDDRIFLKGNNHD